MAARSSFPPSDLSKCVVVIANGEMELNSAVHSKIKSAAAVIVADGGLNHCHRLGIKPSWVVGDFDSVDPSILQEVQAGTTRLKRAKDETDLEVAIKKAKQISGQAQIIIFGGLGGRVDHTLSNVFLLLRDPGKVYLESENQLLFAANSSLGKIRISNPNFKTISLFPLNGKASGVSVVTPNGKVHTLQVDKSCRLSLPFSEGCVLHIEEGELIVCLDKHESSESPFHIWKQMQDAKARCHLKADYADVLTCLDQVVARPRTDFSLQRPVSAIFEDLRHQSNGELASKGLCSANETVFNLRPELGKVTFACKVGQTISLIPFYGPVTGIKTSGLKWELSSSTVDRLDKNFVGVSNVCMGTSFSVEVGNGELLCIINNRLIDLEMVSAKISNDSQQGEVMTQPTQPQSKAAPASSWNKYLEASLIGAGRGLLGLVVEHPFDTVKTRLQADLFSKPTMRGVATDIYTKWGIRGFYAGAIPNGMRLAGKQVYRWPMMVYFPPHFRREIPESVQKAYPASPEIATGMTIANLEAGIINPFERMKVFLMTEREKGKPITKFFVDHRGKIFQEMRRGLGAMFVRQNVTWVSFLVADKKVKDWERAKTGQKTLSTPSLLKVSFIVGLINTAANMPFDVTKTQLQKCNFETGMVSTMVKIAKTEGIKGFYAGSTVRMYQYMIQSAFTVTVLDKLQNKA